jgi:hypothetical protein
MGVKGRTGGHREMGVEYTHGVGQRRMRSELRMRLDVRIRPDVRTLAMSMNKGKKERTRQR